MGNEGESAEVANLMDELKSRKNCIKCILGTIMCCCVLGLVMCILALFAKPGCYTKKVGSVTKKVCADKDQIRMLKIVSVISAVLILIELCIVGKLYHSVKNYEVGGVNNMLKVILCLMVLSVGSTIYNGIKKKKMMQAAVSAGLDLLITGIFVYYIHSYADMIDQLRTKHGKDPADFEAF